MNTSTPKKERQKIVEMLYQKGISASEIACKLKVHPRTISRDLKKIQHAEREYYSKKGSEIRGGFLENSNLIFDFISVLAISDACSQQDQRTRAKLEELAMKSNKCKLRLIQKAKNKNLL